MNTNARMKARQQKAKAGHVGKSPKGGSMCTDKHAHNPAGLRAGSGPCAARTTDSSETQNGKQVTDVRTGLT